jgi:hypothetical protein
MKFRDSSGIEMGLVRVRGGMLRPESMGNPWAQYLSRKIWYSFPGLDI